MPKICISFIFLPIFKIKKKKYATTSKRYSNVLMRDKFPSLPNISFKNITRCKTPALNSIFFNFRFTFVRNLKLSFNFSLNKMQISVREIKIALKCILQKHTFKIFPTIVTLESLRNQVWIFLELYVEDVFTYIFSYKNICM